MLHSGYNDLKAYQTRHLQPNQVRGNRTLISILNNPLGNPGENFGDFPGVSKSEVNCPSNADSAVIREFCKK